MLVFAVVLGLTSTQDNVVSVSVVMIKNLSPIIAHRGASAYAPENTLAAFKKASHFAPVWVEFDVQLAACGTPIVLHDSSVDRTTNGHGEVSTMSYEDIKKLDAGSWFRNEFSGEHIPTFEEVLLCLKACNLPANIEIKANAETTETVLAMLKTHWPSHLPLDVLKVARQLDAELNLGLIFSDWHEHWQDLADEIACQSIHCNYQNLNTEWISAIKKTNRLLLAYTVNDVKHAKQLFNWGVDALFSDYPDLLLLDNA